MKFHPFAEVFPLLEGTAFDELVSDIKTFGLREKIWLYEAKILDGRNRFLACQKAKIKPIYRTFKGTEQGALALVVSANIHRRQLNESQKAMAAARIANLKQGQRADYNHQEVPIGTSAQITGASVRSTKRAKKVLEKGSKALVEAVDAGKITVSRAAAVTTLPKTEQLIAATRPLEQEEWIPDINEDEVLAQAEKEFASSTDKWLQSDDKLSTAQDEIKRQSAEIAALKASRDGYMNRCGDQVRIIKRLRRENESLRKQLGERSSSSNGVEAHPS